jgi:phenylpyruvate tautomerase PptA (4-oxalocrotonate tautomerase family)
MPNVTIEVRKRYTKEQEEAIIDAIHSALMEGIKTPEWDRTIRLLVHEPHRFATPPQKDERYTLIDVDLFTGRSLNAKKAFYRAVVNNLESSEFPRTTSRYSSGRARRRTGACEEACPRRRSISASKSTSRG